MGCSECVPISQAKYRDMGVAESCVSGKIGFLHSGFEYEEES